MKFDWSLRNKAKRVLALVLTAAILAGIVFANDLSMARRLTAYKDVEEFKYLMGNMDYASERWLRNLWVQITASFIDEDSMEGAYQRACMRFNRGDIAGAIPHMENAIELAQEGEKAGLMLETACLSYLTGETEAAHKNAAQAANQMPDSKDAQWYRYKYAAAVGDISSQAEGLGAFAEMDGSQIYLQEAGRLYMALGNYEKSGHYYNRIIEDFGGSDELYYLRGSCRMLTGDYESAISDFKQSGYNGSLYSLGTCELALGHPASAAQYFEASVERGEHIEDSRLMLAACKLELNQPAEAESLLDTYIANGGAYESAAYYRASARAMQGNFEGAIEDYDAALLAGNFPEDTFFGAAQCRYFAGKYEEAVDLFLECIKLNVHPAESRYYLGMTYTEMGELEKAREMLKQSLSLGEAEMEVSEAAE